MSSATTSHELASEVMTALGQLAIALEEKRTASDVDSLADAVTGALDRFRAVVDEVAA